MNAEHRVAARMKRWHRHALASLRHRVSRTKGARVKTKHMYTPGQHHGFNLKRPSYPPGWCSGTPQHSAAALTTAALLMLLRVILSYESQPRVRILNGDAVASVPLSALPPLLPFF